MKLKPFEHAVTLTLNIPFEEGTDPFKLKTRILSCHYKSLLQEFSTSIIKICKLVPKCLI